jgi:glutathione S-transferase
MVQKTTEPVMDLYFSPLACSMASRIALYEAGADVGFLEVDPRTKRLADDTDFLQVNPMGMVPVLRTDGGWLLTENTAILPWIADRFPAAELSPPPGRQRAELQRWLGVVNSELHKAVFAPLLDPSAPDAVKAWTRDKAAQRFEVLQHHLANREYLLDRFSMADAYLATVLNWASYCNIDLSAWPAVDAYFRRRRKRPTVARAFAEEAALYRHEQTRQAQRA